MTADAAEVPVLIVGGGPAGLTASLLLSRHGVESLLVDRRATGSPLPRARGGPARGVERRRGGFAAPCLLPRPGGGSLLVAGRAPGSPRPGPRGVRPRGMETLGVCGV